MLWPALGAADTLRLATYHAELARKGPGLLLRDLEKGQNAQILALRRVVAEVDPDILFLTHVDFDHEMRTLQALQKLLDYPFALMHPPNSMQTTAHDLNGDGRLGDRQVWARYAGAGAPALLSKVPLRMEYHLNDLLWRDFPKAPMPRNETGTIFPSRQTAAAQKLVGQGLWVASVGPDQSAPLSLVVFSNQTPVFDGPEDQNGLRSAGQLTLLKDVMDGGYGSKLDKRFVLVGLSNLDPDAGEGNRAAMRALLNDPRLQDPEPRAPDGSLHTAQFRKAGPLRLSYILPSRDWVVSASGLFAPPTGPLTDAVQEVGRHRLVWVDIVQDR